MWTIINKHSTICDDNDPLFLQAKEAGPSVLTAVGCKSEYANEGQRVVAGQRLMQGASDIFLGWQRVRGIDDVDEAGRPLVDDNLLLLLNAHYEPLPFTLPQTKPEHVWERLLDTALGADTEPSEQARLFRGGEAYPLQDRSVAVLRTRAQEDPEGRFSSAQAELVRRETRLPAAGRSMAIPSSAPAKGKFFIPGLA